MQHMKRTALYNTKVAASCESRLSAERNACTRKGGGVYLYLTSLVAVMEEVSSLFETRLFHQLK